MREGIRVARSSRALVSASRRNELSKRVVSVLRAQSERDGSGSSSPRDAKTNARDARATRNLSRSVFIFLALFFFAASGLAQDVAPIAPAAAPALSINLGGSEQGSVATAIQIVVVMTVLTLAPSILVLMTSFTRIVIVLGFVRSAIGVQGAPSNQVLIGMSLFLTLFIMAPVGKKINEEALQPYMEKKLTTTEAWDKASGPLRTFMMKQTRPSEVDFFLGLADHEGRGDHIHRHLLRFRRPLTRET